MENQDTPTQDDRIISAIANASIILPLWGIIISALVWITQREKSAYIRDQALQALAWQVSQIAVMILGMGCYAISFFVLFSTTFMQPEVPADIPPFFFGPFCVMGLIFLVMFIFIVMGLYAAVRNLQGDEYTYPLVGERIRNYLQRES